VDRPILHGLGVGNGGLTEHPDGSVEYLQTGKLLPAFRVKVRDVVGFSVRRATRDDKKRLSASSLQQVLTLQGSGTTLAEVAVNYGTAERIEAWFRARPEFGASARTPAQPPAARVSVADELQKFVQLRDSGVLTPQEFDAQKARLLGEAGGVSLPPDEPGALADGDDSQFPDAAQSLVDVTLIDPGRRKIDVIKELRERSGLGLREAKDLVDSSPTVIMRAVPLREAEVMRAQLESLGASVAVR
jgi:ribosomal protein L7/L12